MAKIIPGILTNDENDYVAKLKKAEHAADLVQIDVVDGRFAPNITLGVDFVKKHPSKCMLEVQLMVKEPAVHIKNLNNVDFVSRILFPFETRGVRENIYLVKKQGQQVGLSINPETSLEDIAKYSNNIDLLCIFSASPGFAGQKLQEATYGRIKKSKKYYPRLPVEIDIGVNFETAPKLVRAGADFLIATSALHSAEDFYLAYSRLAKLAQVAR